MLPVYVSVLVTGVWTPLLSLSAAETSAAKSPRIQSISFLVRTDLQQGVLSAPGTSIDWWLREDIVHTSQMTDRTASVFNRNWLKDDQLRGSR
jgi:hypothetical protein